MRGELGDGGRKIVFRVMGHASSAEACEKSMIKFR